MVTLSLKKGANNFGNANLSQLHVTAYGIRVTDIHKAYEYLTSKNMSFESKRLVEEGIWAPFFRDPDDNLLHLIQRPL
jgi:hypothetical protein